jgi:hypothetical protein
MKECCINCKLCFPLVKFDYSQGGCKHSDMDGYVCMAFALAEQGEPPVAIWMVGCDPSRDMCECYIPKGDIEWNA